MMAFLDVLILVAGIHASSVLAFPSYGQQTPLQSTSSEPPFGLIRNAVPYASEYSYTGAKLDGRPGTGKGGVRVPAAGDTAHYYQDPPPGAHRGPCPGMNTLANHGFISRDGVTTYTELVAALQNVYNVEYSAAVLLTTMGIAFDGDPLTEMLSIGGDATFETTIPGEFTGLYGGLSRHGTFELDASLTRDDFSLHGDSHTFNATRFKMMTETVSTTSSKENPLFDFKGIALYRAQIYDTSRQTNPHFYFPSLVLHNYGASTFLFNTFPSSSKNNTPDLETIASFFGAVPLPDGNFGSQPERIPPEWTNQVKALTMAGIIQGINKIYGAYPKEFGGNYGIGRWVSLEAPRGRRNFTSPDTGADDEADSEKPHLGACNVASTFISTLQLAPDPIAMAFFLIPKLDPIFSPLGCNVTKIILGD